MGQRCCWYRSGMSTARLLLMLRGGATGRDMLHMLLRPGAQRLEAPEEEWQ